MAKGILVKKIIYLLLAFLALAGTVSCGSTSIFHTKTQVPPQVITEHSATSTPSATVDTGKLNGINIRFMYPWTGNTQSEIEAMVAEFNQSNEWGIHVVTDAPGSSSAVLKDIRDEIDYSNPAEVIAAPIDNLLTLNQNGEWVQDLTPYVESSEWGLTSEDIDFISPVFWDQDIVDDFRYGLPAQRTAKIIIYNKTWAEELGFSTAPNTFKELENQACEATGVMKLDNNPLNDGLGGWVVDTDAATNASWILGNGALFSSTAPLTFNATSTSRTFSELRQMYDNGCAWLGSKPAPYEYFANRQALFYSGDLQDLVLQQNAQKIANSNDAWVIIPFPSTSEPVVLAQGPSYALLKDSPEKQLASWMFIRWMSEPDQQGRLVRASATLPLGEKSIQYAVELEDTLPQWAEVERLLQYVQVPPSVAGWSKAEIVLEDASWQLFKTDLKISQIPDLVKQMQSTLLDLTGEVE